MRFIFFAGGNCALHLLTGKPPSPIALTLGEKEHIYLIPRCFAKTFRGTTDSPLTFPRVQQELETMAKLSPLESVGFRES